MEHAGTDLETVKIKRWSEAAAILWQVGLALSAAEESLQFEVRLAILVDTRDTDARYIVAS